MNSEGTGINLSADVSLGVMNLHRSLYASYSRGNDDIESSSVNGLLIFTIILIGIIGLAGICSSFLNRRVALLTEESQKEDADAAEEEKKAIVNALNQTKVVSKPPRERRLSTSIDLITDSDNLCR